MPDLVQEVIDGLPSEGMLYIVERDEALLLNRPDPGPFKLWPVDAEPLKAVHFPQEYVPSQFAIPQDVYGGDSLRLEWQKMNNRQPIYHRNSDVEEISFQVTGERSLATELGSVELTPGDFCRIPVGVAHDNWGRSEVHLIFYIYGPIAEVVSSCRQSKADLPPYEGWEGKVVTELLTECMGKGACPLAVFQTDETVLLGRATRNSGPPMNVLRAEGLKDQVEWVYKTPEVWIGSVSMDKASSTKYYRHRRATEIQYQVKGTRTLVSQQGTIELVPGDFTNIPKGCAFTSKSEGESVHLVVLTSKETPMIAQPTKEAKLPGK